MSNKTIADSAWTPAQMREKAARDLEWCEANTGMLTVAPEHAVHVLRTVIRGIDADAELATLRQKLAEAEKERDGAVANLELQHEVIGLIERDLGIEPDNTTKSIGGELNALRAALAAAEADCAAMRDLFLKHLGELDACGEPTSLIRNEFAALTGRPTGQAIMDELSAARKVCEIAQWQENGGMWPENYADALDAYRAARKANT